MPKTCPAMKDAFVARFAVDGESPEEEEKAATIQRPLVRTTNIATTTVHPYRLMIYVRMGIFMFFFKWRLSSAGFKSCTHDEDTIIARSIWAVSVAGELWFAMMWVLDQLPKIRPVRRAADVTALKESLLPAMDVFVATADPEKEPPLTTANTVLSILAADYPPDKLTCYVSDDGGALLTHEVLAEAARFAGLWVPFCRKHAVEPRNPEAYFVAGSVDGKARVVMRVNYSGEAWPELARDRRRVRREYEESRLRINALQAGDNGIRRRRWSPDYGNDTCRRGTAEDHAGVVQVLIGPLDFRTVQLGVAGDGNPIDLTSVDVRLPALVYVCREKRPSHTDHRKAAAMNSLLRASAVLSNAPFVLNLDCDHYVNNSQALRAGACFVLDDGGHGGCGGNPVAFVQFPQRFDGVDPGDRYSNHNRVFFDCTELGLDGLQGPIYVGTGCIFRRAALYGGDPPRWRHKGGAPTSTAAMAGKFGVSTTFLDSVRAAIKQQEQRDNRLLDDEAAIAEACALVSCVYEDGTGWGRDIGWMYGTVTEDVATGLSLHRRGWRSAYCATAPDAFRGTAPINLADRLNQVLRWAAGSLEIFFSGNNPLLAGRRLHPLQRVAYLNTTVYPFTSLFLLVYCLFPAAAPAAAALDRPPPATYVAFLAALMLTLAAVAALEVRWSGITGRDWWRNQQFWMISATSAYPAAVAQVALKVAAGKEISFRLTPKQSSAGAAAGKDSFAELHAVRWTVLMVPTAAVLAVNVASMAARVEGSRWRKAPAAALAVAFNAWVVAHLHPFALGLMGRRSKAVGPVLLLFVVAFITVRLLHLILQFSTPHLWT